MSQTEPHAEITRNTEADEWEYDKRTGRYRNKRTGRFMSHNSIINARETYLGAREKATADTVWDIYRRAEGLEPGSPPWISVMNELDRIGWREIENTQITAYVYGRGGMNNLTPADHARLNTMLTGQRDYWDNFMDEARSGKMQTHAGISHRTNLYTNNARSFHARAMAESWGVDLPTHPGEQRCGPNCKCSWQIKRRKDRVEAFWRIDAAAENCDDCLSHSTNYNPLVFEIEEES